ncbi:RNA-directed DNA polymerase, eukaryota, reverse transcriptase zinc-binding domain protein [Tanacetum coccineum]|uniref:RNA-directed DNA polymerase, eukaryota, reverse transcriptase zinc-binding domain protein n=1 Tax=Tanacetum coccineum TaxID=301880 RepID=A0ABQ5FTY1_9ASTR
MRATEVGVQLEVEYVGRWEGGEGRRRGVAGKRQALVVIGEYRGLRAGGIHERPEKSTGTCFISDVTGREASEDDDNDVLDKLSLDSRFGESSLMVLCEEVPMRKKSPGGMVLPPDFSFAGRHDGFAAWGDKVSGGEEIIRWRRGLNGRMFWPLLIKARVIKVIHGRETGLDLKVCNCNGVWSSIISSYAMLHERNILPINTLCRKVGNDVNVDCLLSDRRFNDAWVWNWKRQVMGSRNEAALALLVSELGQVQFSDRPDSLPTRLNLSLRGLEIPSIECPICNIGMESVDHVFFGCELAFGSCMDRH